MDKTLMCPLTFLEEKLQAKRIPARLDVINYFPSEEDKKWQGLVIVENFVVLYD